MGMEDHTIISNGIPIHPNNYIVIWVSVKLSKIQKHTKDELSIIKIYINFLSQSRAKSQFLKK